MKINKPSKKIVIFSAIFIIVGLSSLIVYNSHFKQDNEKVVAETYLKIFKSANNCDSQFDSINIYTTLGLYNKRLLEQGKDKCNQAANKIKSIEIPEKLPNATRLILQNSKENFIKSCNYIAFSQEELIETGGKRLTRK